MAQWPYSTRAWQRLRLAKLAESPLCEVCATRGKVVPASAVDHKQSIRSGGEAFPDLAGLMSLCASCHGVKTAARDAPHIRPQGDGIAFKGCDSDGIPIDPTHPFMVGGGVDIDRGLARTAPLSRKES